MFVRRGPLRHARMLARVTAGSLEAAERQCAPPEEKQRLAQREDRGSEAGRTGRSDLVAEPPKPEGFAT